MSDRPPDDPWDAALAARLPGKLILVGITFLNPDGQVNEHQQMCGRVEHVDSHSGIRLKLDGSRAGETYNLPPSTGPFNVASPGSYRLRSTGEVVVDPDYTAQWTVHAPAKGTDYSKGWPKPEK